MRAKAALSMSFVAALGLALMGCPSPQPPPPAPTPGPSPSPASQACVDFEPPLPAGAQYGRPGQSSGDVVFTTNGIPVSVYDFVFANGGGAFNSARIEQPPTPFSSGQSIGTNNINLEFDFTSLGLPRSQVQFDFLDMSGFENISVNGSPVFAGEFSAAPNPIGGVKIVVNTVPVANGKKGTVILLGTVDKLRIGGQELWIDQVCVKR